MATNRDSSMGVCEKLHSAFSRHCPRRSGPGNAIPTPQSPILKHSVTIPIEHDPPVSSITSKETEKAVKDDKVKHNNEVVRTHVVVLKKPKSKAYTAQPEKVGNGSGLGHVQVAEPEKAEPKKAGFGHGQKHVAKAENNEGKNSGIDNGDDKFSDFIDSAKMKMKMRAASNVGRGKIAPKFDSFNDKVSNYITRAKIKLRTTSSISEKSVSFK